MYLFLFIKTPQKKVVNVQEFQLILNKSMKKLLVLKKTEKNKYSLLHLKINNRIEN